MKTNAKRQTSNAKRQTVQPLATRAGSLLLLRLMFGVWSLAFGVLRSAADESAILGYTEPYRLITVSAGEAGVIGEVLVKEGERVIEKQVLAKLDTAVLAAELEIARAPKRSWPAPGASASQSFRSRRE